MQIIQARFYVIVVSAVAEGVLLPDGARQAPCAGCRLPPRVVGIAYHLFPVWIQDPGDIPMQIFPVIVRGPVVLKPQQLAVVVIQEIDPLIPCLLGQDRGAVQVKGRDGIPVLLGHPVSVFIVSVGIGLPAFRVRRELPAMLPGKGCPIPPGERVPDLIIGDAFPVIGGQLVLPSGIPIGIAVHRQGIPGI